MSALEPPEATAEGPGRSDRVGAAESSRERRETERTIEPVVADDLLLAAGLAVQALAGVADANWDAVAGELRWTCRRTLDHIVDTELSYAAHLAIRARGPLPPPRRGDPHAKVSDLLVSVRTCAEILATVVRAEDPTTRAYHPAGAADPEGFAAMGCDEILIHADDIAQGLGVAYEPPSELCASVLERLFPWAPIDEDPWAELLWANGRTALPDRPRLEPDWGWHCAPLAEWDGEIARARS